MATTIDTSKYTKVLSRYCPNKKSNLGRNIRVIGREPENFRAFTGDLELFAEVWHGSADTSRVRVLSADGGLIMAEDSFPREFPLATGAAGLFEVPTAAVRHVCEHVAPVCDTVSVRYALGGVEIVGDGRTARFTATDGKRIHTYWHAAQTSGGFPAAIVPMRAFEAFAAIVRARFGSWKKSPDVVTFAIDSDGVEISTPGARVYSRLVQGRFPRCEDYQSPHCFKAPATTWDVDTLRETISADVVRHKADMAKAKAEAEIMKRQRHGKHTAALHIAAVRRAQVRFEFGGHTDNFDGHYLADVVDAVGQREPRFCSESGGSAMAVANGVPGESGTTMACLMPLCVDQ